MSTGRWLSMKPVMMGNAYVSGKCSFVTHCKSFHKYGSDGTFQVIDSSAASSWIIGWAWTRAVGCLGSDGTSTADKARVLPKKTLPHLIIYYI